MNCYFDTSVLLSLILRDQHSSDALAWFERLRPIPFVSSFAASEFSAVASRHVRAGQLTSDQGRQTLNIFDAWLRRNAQTVTIENDDIVKADAIVRNFELKLLAPDALHLSINNRLGTVLATFDKRLVAAAQLQAIKAIVPN